MPYAHSELDEKRLLAWLVAAARAHSGLFLLGICGAQGSGKSTLAHRLAQALDTHHLRAAILSIDDLYRTRAERTALAQTVHPLLITRGVPGTHDLELGRKTIAAAAALQPGQSLALPRFDKANDERRPEQDWPQIEGPLDILILEGWCVGLDPEPEAALQRAVNALETHEDPDGRWRRWVNRQLATDYAEFFARLDRLIFLQIPDWEAVLRWRRQQECETAAAARGPARHVLDEAGLLRFIQHYERLTRHALASLPGRADVLRRLGPAHEVTEQLIRTSNRSNEQGCQ